MTINSQKVRERQGMAIYPWEPPCLAVWVQTEFPNTFHFYREWSFNCFKSSKQLVCNNIHSQDYFLKFKKYKMLVLILAKNFDKKLLIDKMLPIIS